MSTARPVDESGGARELQLEADLAGVARPGERGTYVVVLFVLALPLAHQHARQALVRPPLEPVCVPARVTFAQVNRGAAALELLVSVVSNRLEHEESRLAVRSFL